jgi:UDP-N-acetylglucosamine 4,6-dehydratase
MLITGSGSFAKAFVRQLLQGREYNRICIYSRGEQNQMEMREMFNNDPRLRFFLGDIRDRERLKVAMRGISTVVHSAAIKDIASCYYNSTEAVRTNVEGTSNVIEVAATSGVLKMVTLSSDKAANPCSIYGTSKLLAEQLTLSANHTHGPLGTRFTAVRYGNISGSARSVIPKWRKALAEGREICITDPEVTRFHMFQEEAVQLVLDSIAYGSTEAPSIPDLPAYKLSDLAEAMGIKEYKIIGLPDYEKRHETMDGITDSSQARRLSVDELKEILKRV